MSVQLDPPDLVFRRPFTHEVTQLLRLSNPSKDPIAFKVKTTAPKQYCVRPNSGRIEVGSEVEVQVLLQAMQQDPPPDARCRDKFLVQSIAITPDREMGSTTAIWQNVEKTAKDAIEERKIRVVFLPLEGAGTTPKHAQLNGTHLGDDAPPAYGSSSPYGTPAPEHVAPGARDISSNGSRLSGDSKKIAEPGKDVAPSSSSSLGAAMSSVTGAIPISGEGLKAQIAETKSTSTNSTSQNGERGLRQRKPDAANTDAREGITTARTGMNVHQQPAAGVPVQIVAALCLLSFLLAYFFF